MIYYPGLSSRPWWSLSELRADVAAGIERVVEAREDLLAEYDALAAASPAGDYVTGENEHTLNTPGKWTWQTAIAKGSPRTDFAIAAPRTMAALAAVPSLLTGGVPFAYAFFSSLRSGADIAPHFGPSNTRLRVHVPLRVPAQDGGEGACLTVAGESRVWRVGEPLIFDDAFEHAARNHTKEDRLVLLFDIWHPDLTMEERAGVEDMFKLARKEGWLK